MCRTCAYQVKTVWNAWWKNSSFPHGNFLATSASFLYTWFAGFFTQLIRITTSMVFNLMSHQLPTYSTAPTITTIYIKNIVMDGQRRYL